MNPQVGSEGLRVGDAERDEVTSALHEHFAQGRLDREELDERLSSSLSAKTAGDLREVLRDLPGHEAPGYVPARHHRGRYGPGLGWPGAHGRRLGAYGPPGAVERASWGPAETSSGGRGAVTYGRGSWSPGPYGWRPGSHGPAPWGPGALAYGPRRGRPVGLVLIPVVIAAAVTGAWVIFPFFALVWFAGAFLRMRSGRRWHQAAPRRRLGAAQ